MRLTERISAFINAESLLTRGSRVIVGLSGGADSVALLSLLDSLGYECIAVHCHFGLRGAEADRDATHAERIALKLRVRFSLVRFDTRTYMRRHNLSAEMACRELRYNEFERIRIQHRAEAIAVGHHCEDNIETMFLNLLRGSGLHGIKGMLPKRDNIIRPLLEVSRRDITEYLAEQKLPYVTDSSNLENDFKRNKLRNIVIPTILEAFPDAMKTLGRTLRDLRDSDTLYRSMLPERSDSLRGVGATLLHEWLEPFGFNSTQCHKILQSNPGAEFRSPTHSLTLCVGGRYELHRLDEQAVRPRLAYRTISATGAFKPQRGKLYVDAKDISSTDEFELRLWRRGDRMRPFGMNGYRLVSDVMNDCGICATERRRTWLLCRNGEVLWIVGHRASNHFKVTEKTTDITEIYIDHENL